MDSERIKKDYGLFQIPVEKIPPYENPNQFAQNFKRCSIYEYVAITYSESTTANKKHPNQSRTEDA